MAYIKNKNLLTEFNAAVLDIAINSMHKKPAYKSTFDFLVMTDLAKKIASTKRLQTEDVLQKLYETTATLVKFYPRDTKIPEADFRLFCVVNPEIENLIKKFPRKLTWRDTVASNADAQAITPASQFSCMQLQVK
jgi:uncharacterized protein (DUF2132 family)